MSPAKHPRSSGEILKKIKQHLCRKGGRMTDLREEILATMSELKKPKTAYQILDAVNRRRKPRLSAMSLYRTLEFLMEAGVVLKLESLNAYELCLKDKTGHSHLMMVCDKCGNLREVDDPAVSKTLSRAAQKHGHKLKHHVIELHGVCEQC